MKAQTTKLAGVVLLEPRVFPDARGWFFEGWNARAHEGAGLSRAWVQDNFSRSLRGVVRGLHFQNPHAQSKLVSCLEGEIWDVVVDLRKDSPTFGQWEAFELGGAAQRQLFVPQGFAHGFQVVSDFAIVGYKVDDFWATGAEAGVAWDDPDLSIPWPLRDAVVSAKDAALPRLRELPRERLF